LSILGGLRSDHILQVIVELFGFKIVLDLDHSKLNTQPHLQVLGSFNVSNGAIEALHKGLIVGEVILVEVVEVKGNETNDLVLISGLLLLNNFDFERSLKEVRIGFQSEVEIAFGESKPILALIKCIQHCALDLSLNFEFKGYDGFVVIFKSEFLTLLKERYDLIETQHNEVTALFSSSEMISLSASLALVLFVEGEVKGQNS